MITTYGRAKSSPFFCDKMALSFQCLMWHRRCRKEEKRMTNKDRRWIYEKKSSAKGNEGKIVGYEVKMRLPNGKLVSKNFSLETYTTLKQALKNAIIYRDDMLYRKRNDLLVSEEKKEVETVEELFFKIPENNARLKIGTLVKYRKLYNKYIKPRYSDTNIESIKHSDVVSTLKECSYNCGSKQISDLKSVWNKIFQVALYEGIGVVNWAREVECPESKIESSMRSKEEKNISQKDFEEYLEYMKEYGHYLPNEFERLYFRQIMIYLLQVLRVTGMRCQEAKALKREDIHFETKEYLDQNDEMHKKEFVVIHICHSVGSTNDEVITIRGTKTAFSERTLAYDAADLFKEILSFSKHDVIFADYDGNLISTNRFTHYIHDVCRYIEKHYGKKIEMYGYLLRHSFVSDLRAAGVPDYIIQKYMGHKPGSAVTQVYGSPSDDILLENIMKRKYKE